MEFLGRQSQLPQDPEQASRSKHTARLHYLPSSPRDIRQFDLILLKWRARVPTPTVGDARSSMLQGVQQTPQGLRINGLHEMVIKPGLRGAATIFLLTPTR